MHAIRPFLLYVGSTKIHI